VAAARGAETDKLSLVTTHKHTGTAGVVLKKDVDRAWPRRRSWTACLPIQPTGRDVGWRARQTSVRRHIVDLSDPIAEVGSSIRCGGAPPFGWVPAGARGHGGLSSHLRLVVLIYLFASAGVPTRMASSTAAGISMCYHGV
jgi:hypothetical protein